ncbi:MAG: hypothetical protein RL885_31485 [Planctomycetota bacterium]
MRIVHDAEGVLRLCGRRIEGEQGEEGLWLVWLVGILMCAAGIAFGFLLEAEDSGFRLAGFAAIAFGVLLLGCGVSWSLRRESLTLEAASRQATYCRYLGAGWRTKRVDFDFQDAKEVRLKTKLESPSTGRADGASVSYRKLEANLHVRPRLVILLERTRNEERARATATRVAEILGAPIVE